MFKDHPQEHSRYNSIVSFDIARHVINYGITVLEEVMFAIVSRAEARAIRRN